MRPLALLGPLLCACAAPPDATVHVAAFEGTAVVEGHFERPHETRTLPVSVTLHRGGDRARCELREGSDAKPTVIVRDADGRCWSQASGAKRFAPDPGEGERLLRLLLAATIAATTADGAALELPFPHDRLGDVVDSARWRESPADRELCIAWHRTADRCELTLRATAAAAPTDLVTGERALFSVDPANAAAATPPAAAKFRTIAPGVHEVVLADVPSRSLAIEFADHLVLCETSIDNRAGERLLAALDAHVPGKPVRHVLFGHYHPHYTGGLRPVMARGATVVAPPLGAAFAREIAARTFAKPPDALAASGRVPAIESFTGERRFADASNELVAIDIGADSHHTAEYVVFWLPRQRLLFQGDLGWFGVGAGVRASGSRARGLLSAIDGRRLPVAQLVQSWPVDGPATMPIETFRALLAK